MMRTMRRRRTRRVRAVDGDAVLEVDWAAIWELK